MSKIYSHVGQRFDRLVVVERLGKQGSAFLWRCICDCGKEKITLGVRLRNGQCGSCGCKMRESTAKSFTTHGKSQTLEYKLLKDARKRAKEFNREYNITLEDIYIPDVCPVLGILLIPTKGGKCTNNSPSLDRVDSSKGYIKGNVKIISMRANRLKQDSTIEELENLIKYMKNGI